MRKKTRGNLFFALIIACLASCGQGVKTSALREGQAYVIDVNRADTLLRHHIASIDFLPLDVDIHSFLFAVREIESKNDMFYLSDSRAAKIVAYDTLGHVRFVLDKKGQGPEEYFEIANSTVDDKYVYVIDNFRHALNLYDCQTGAYVETKKLPFVVWDMGVLPDGNFIFTYIPFDTGEPNVKQTQHKIFITDRNLNIRKRMFEYAKDEFEFIGRRTYFTDSPEGVVFSSNSSDDLYVFSGVDSVRQITLQVKNGIPQKYRQDRDKIAESKYCYLSGTPFFCRQYFCLSMVTGEYMENLVYDREKHSLSMNDKENAYKGLLPPVSVYGDKLVAYLDNNEMYKELVKYGFEQSTVIERHLEEEKPVLILYTMN